MSWKKGESGNPGGRSKARQELGDAFLRVLRSDWEEHGAQSVIDMRQKDPVAYVKVVAAMLPNQVDVDVRHSLVDALKELNEQYAATPVDVGQVEEGRAGSVCH